LRATLHAGTGDCQVLAGAVFRELPQLIRNTRTVVVTDSTVRGLHGATFPPGDVIEIGQGESAKSLETVDSLYRRFLSLGIDSDSMILAVGGGIVCDVAAFAAATWLRGLRVGLVPTTLLAQADAGLGGKNGVNFGGIKNLIGTIRQPSFVLCDPVFLRTLPEVELRNGLAEVAKAAAVRDPELFRLLEDKADTTTGFDSATLQEAIQGAIRVKLAVVGRDEMGGGERAVLNFGHTLGHAIEATLGLRHGEAVSIGMVFAARLSVARRRMRPEGLNRLENLLGSLGLPTSITTDPAPLIEAVSRDKKRAGNCLRMALLQEIGEAIVEPVEFDELASAIADLR